MGDDAEPKMRESATARPLVAGRYRLEDMLGRGAMGVVWRATDELIGRSVAVKEVGPPPGLPVEERTLFRERALREARAAGRINHPAAVTIYDVVPATGDDEAVYIVTELVTAPTLAEVLRREGAVSAHRVAMLAVRLLDALEAAHTVGVVHRDVKPSNIMVLDDAEVKLVDFGIAHTSGETRLTRVGVVGSAGYLAPELFQGESPSPAADLWAAGMTLLHAVDGREPFDGASTAAAIHGVLYGDLPPVRCDPPLADVIGGLLTRDPQRRMTLPQARKLLTTAVDARPTPRLRAAIPPEEGRASSPEASPNHGQHPASRQNLTWEDKSTRIHQGPSAASLGSASAGSAESNKGLTLKSSVNMRSESSVSPGQRVLLSVLVVAAVFVAKWMAALVILLFAFIWLLRKAAVKLIKQTMVLDSAGISVRAGTFTKRTIPWSDVLSVSCGRLSDNLVIRVQLRLGAPMPRQIPGVTHVASDRLEIAVPWPPAPEALAEMLGRPRQNLDLRPEAGWQLIRRTIDRFAPQLTVEDS